MKKIYAINGSPRKNRNTATMLEKFLEGASSVGNVETKLIHLSDYNFKGCIGCHACKLDNDTIYGKCQVKDEIYKLLQEIPMADGVVFGSPMYFHDVTSAMRAFLERLMYQSLTLELPKMSSASKDLHTAMIYTMGMTEERKTEYGYETIFKNIADSLQRICRKESTHLCAYGCPRFDSSNRYRISSSSPIHQQDNREFDSYCQEAFKAGQQMVLNIKADNERSL